MNESLSWHTLRALATGSRRAGLLALVAIVLVAIFVLWTSRSVVRAVATAPATASTAPAAAGSSVLAADMKLHADRINGRSLFFIPDRPHPVQADTGPRPAANPAPTRYAGPPLVAMMNDTAWFLDGTRLVLGADPAPGAAVRLITLSPPWSARVEWKGVEFDVSLFERSAAFAPPKPTETPPVALPDSAEVPQPTTSTAEAPKPSESPAPEPSAEPPSPAAPPVPTEAPKPPASPPASPASPASETR